MAVRRLTVTRTEELTPAIIRVTLTGDSLEDFAAPGPGDHVKVYFPDPATGALTVPELTADGIRRPAEGTIISRDYTPSAFRPMLDGGAELATAELDLDFVLHADAGSRVETMDAAGGGPASAWAAQAEPGDELGIAGPRGSRLVPKDASEVVLIADETGFAALGRWLAFLPEATRVSLLLDVADEEAEPYFRPDQLKRAASVEWLYREDGPGQLEEAVRSMSFDQDVYVWAAGEATALVPVRRYLKHEAGLGKDQLDLQGYWKRGIVNRDHHEPLDPSDPD